ncbi:alpha/beta fold hydrolase [Kutzneria kofuensis]|uniref:3-oxoadipate enol-lactonase n=1 Tax=Kutzneria kofuensis TaxID=103725 RepID=A0A7W9NL40_9PSEU|nr:alpha/beta fold hydrolase [Kutzneria kofuensis]MBB5897277.1 3-oxoadipate enol-lactonase [Kutzneria kofuensis]
MTVTSLADARMRGLATWMSLDTGFPRQLDTTTVVDDQPQLHRVRLADHDTVVAQRGDSGPAVLLVHALGLDWQMWEPVMDSLAVGRRVFAYDVRGHGMAAGSPSPYTMADTARDLIGVLDAIGVERAHVVGLSFGGGIAQTAAVAAPERFASLALLATTDVPFDAFEGRASSGETDGMAAQVAPSLTRWFTANALAVNGESVQYARERVLGGNSTDWAAAWRAFKGLDVRGRLAGLGLPTLVLAGEHDVSTTPEIMRGIAARIPGSQFRVLPGTPHMQTLEQPGLVAAALAEFLR